MTTIREYAEQAVGALMLDGEVSAVERVIAALHPEPPDAQL